MWQSLNVWVRHKQIKTPYTKSLRASHEVFMAVWGGCNCLGYVAISHGNHFTVFQRSVAFIQGLEVQEKCYGRARRGKTLVQCQQLMASWNGLWAIWGVEGIQ